MEIIVGPDLSRLTGDLKFHMDGYRAYQELGSVKTRTVLSTIAPI